jgi:hypothetical protein
MKRSAQRCASALAHATPVMINVPAASHVRRSLDPNGEPSAASACLAAIDDKRLGTIETVPKENDLRHRFAIQQRWLELNSSCSL